MSNTQPEPAPPPDAPPPSKHEQIYVKMNGFADLMCACTDAECAKRVNEELTAWGMEMAKNQDQPEELTEEEQKRFTEVGTRMGECMAKAMGAAAPSP